MRIRFHFGVEQQGAFHHDPFAAAQTLADIAVVGAAQRNLDLAFFEHPGTALHKRVLMRAGQNQAAVGNPDGGLVLAQRTWILRVPGSSARPTRSTMPLKVWPGHASASMVTVWPG